MAGMVKGKTLDVAQVKHRVREVLEHLPGGRRGKNLPHGRRRGKRVLGALLMQYSSLLEYRQRMAQEQGRNNVLSQALIRPICRYTKRLVGA